MRKFQEAEEGRWISRGSPIHVTFFGRALKTRRGSEIYFCHFLT